MSGTRHSAYRDIIRWQELQVTTERGSPSSPTVSNSPFGICSPIPLSEPGQTFPQNIAIIRPDGKSYPVRTCMWTVTGPGVESFGHGSIKNNITSPGRGSDVLASR